MRIKLNRLYSEPQVFEPIFFRNGVNLILGEKVGEQNVKKGKKTNGVGKSMCVEFINFCLLKSKTNSRVSKIPEDKLSEDTKIILDLEINSKAITIIRTKKNPDKPTIVVDGKENDFLNIEDANHYLKELLFIDAKGETPSFREFIGPFIRDEESEFKDILRCYDLSKRTSPAIIPHAFMFGFDLSLIKEIQRLFKEIDRVNSHKLKLKSLLTHDSNKNISDIKAILNSLNNDLKKIDATLDNFKTNRAFESLQEDIENIQIEIDELRIKQAALRYELIKLRSFPSIELIKQREIEIVYEQFKAGLGSIVIKSIEEVIDFKNRIDTFQKGLLREKITTLEGNLNTVSKKLERLEDQKVKKLKVIDNKGVLKDIKSSFEIFHQKKDEFSRLQSQYESYESAVNEWKTLRVEKDQKFLDLDAQIVAAKKVIESFNDTILSIHEYIMDSSEASFQIQTINTDKNKQILIFEMRIDDDGSHSVERTKVFIYDLALLFNEYTCKLHPKLLIHDNIFDVDQDTLVKSLNYLSIKENEDFQYILTLNRDKVENEEHQKLIQLNIEEHRIANFTKMNRFLIGDKYSEV